jgi:hypothetical protein
MNAPTSGALTMKRIDDTTKLADKKTIIYAALIVAIIIVPTVFVLQLLTSRPNTPKAAIIDQLSSSHLSPTSQYPNQTFIDLARGFLSQRFDSIDYYRDNASVENYRQLPSRGYKVIIWRAHSALDLGSKYVAISTSDRELLTSYDNYMQNQQLTLCNITGDPYLYFAINPKFIREVMNGRFEDTVIIMMSCNGLKAEYYETATAFQDKGAKVLISWDGWISSADNDDATTHLLSYLVAENDTVSDAVSKIPEYSSPEFGRSTLRYSPMVPSTSNYHMPDYREVAQARTQSMATTACTTRRLRPSLVRVLLGTS